MLAKRIIPYLDCDFGVAQGRVVKGTKFKEIRYAGVPWELAEKYYKQGADEIVFLDITASSEKRETMAGVIEKTSERVFVPLTVGGGIRTVSDFGKLFRAGADKCSINTAAIKDPDLIYPDQQFELPRDSSQDEIDAAVHEAKTRGPWSLWDGK